MTKEQARANLVLFYNMGEPTDQELASFILYGDSAPFLMEEKRARVAEKFIPGGHAMKGKTIEEALKLKNKDVVEALHGLPANKVHCSVLAQEVVEAAVKDYREKQANK